MADPNVITTTPVVNQRTGETATISMSKPPTQPNTAPLSGGIGVTTDPVREYFPEFFTPESLLQSYAKDCNFPETFTLSTNPQGDAAVAAMRDCLRQKGITLDVKKNQ